MDTEKLIKIYPKSNYNLPLIYISSEYFIKSKNYDNLIKVINHKINNTILFSKKFYKSQCFAATIDLKNSKMSQVDFKFIKLLIDKLEKEYPDNLLKLELKNMNNFIKGIFRILKAFIHPDTLKKIVVLGNDNKKDTQLTNSITNNSDSGVGDNSSSVSNGYGSLNNFDPEMITNILNNMKNQK